MAIKKSELYRSLWSSCDELRGGMDASQYKDYVLTLLFVKYVSDKYAGKPHALIEVPEGGSFEDMVRLRGDKEIGDKINKIIGRLADANDLKGVIDVADFNDEDKLGGGKDMVDRLSNLVGIFANLNLSANRAEGDDLLGDAYEYLMRHFATESGKSKGQFYTPAEVSRVMARVLDIGPSTGQDRTVYDPTCGSGSLLLKVADEAPRGLSIYGQEMDNSTWALARMNMFLHDEPSAEIWRGNTLTSPHWRNADGSLKTFDFAVANPPFSAKSWSNGLDPEHDEFGRFEMGVPPAKNGDYAFLLHIVKSLKSTGKGAVILPHGVLFRGHAEAKIRRNLVRQGYIKGIIGLPANLFYGTGIPACIVVLDKENAHARRGIFMIDASRGFVKDGNKNRLRSQDMHKIVDVFKHGTEEPRYSRMVGFVEIEENDFNLYISRYIDSSDPEDLHDLGAHLNGGIPERDIDALSKYWKEFPTLRRSLFTEGDRMGYGQARVPAPEVRATVLENPEFASFKDRVLDVFDGWRGAHDAALRGLDRGSDPKSLITDISEDLLARFDGQELVSRYDVYQHLMDYWAEEMQDDVYAIAQDGWDVIGRVMRPANDKETPDLVVKEGNRTTRYVAELIPPSLVIARFFEEEQAEVDRLAAETEAAAQARAEFEEEHGGEEGVLSGLEGKNGIPKGNVQNRVMELRAEALETVPMYTVEYEQAREIKRASFGTTPWQKGVQDAGDIFAELDLLHDYLRLMDAEVQAKKAHKEAADALDRAVLAKYPELSEEEMKALVVDDKWMAAVEGDVRNEVERVAETVAGRVKVLEERYAESLPSLVAKVDSLTDRVDNAMQQLLTGKQRLREFNNAQGHKSTEVGLVPEDWKVKPLKEISSMAGRIGWQGLKQEEFTSNPDDPFLITGMNFKGGRIDWEEAYHLPWSRYEEAPNIQLKTADVLMTKDGTIGKLLYVEEIPYPGKASLNSHLLVLRPLNNEYVPKFLFYQLASKMFSDYVEVNKSGSTFFGITQEAVGNYKALLPPIEEQEAIANVLSDMDAEISALEARQAKMRQIKQGMMQELLTGKTRLV